uniref:Uncharacterized protein n=1 Tax=Rhipicephalus zambeziensis TaxID=60191 RepID=A0A224Y7I0_9ACAR
MYLPYVDGSDMLCHKGHCGIIEERARGRFVHGWLCQALSSMRPRGLVPNASLLPYFLFCVYVLSHAAVASGTKCHERKSRGNSSSSVLHTLHSPAGGASFSARKIIRGASGGPRGCPAAFRAEMFLVGVRLLRPIP